MALAPKQVDSTIARKTAGALVPILRPVMAPFSNWFASGVLLPFNQSTADSLSLSSGICSAWRLNSAIMLAEIALASSFAESVVIAEDLSSMFCNGHDKRFLNHAYA